MLIVDLDAPFGFAAIALGYVAALETFSVGSKEGLDSRACQVEACLNAWALATPSEWSSPSSMSPSEALGIKASRLLADAAILGKSCIDEVDPSMGYPIDAAGYISPPHSHSC